jgi:hypothetical protein
VSPQELIAEAEILAALARGDENAEGVRERKGKPIDLDAYFATPADVRMAFSMLKGVELVPEELELLKEINRLKEQVAALDRKDGDVQVGENGTQTKVRDGEGAITSTRVACAPQNVRSALQRKISELYRYDDEDANLPAQGEISVPRCVETRS